MTIRSELGDQMIDMLLHHMQFIFFVIAYYFFNNVFHCLDEVFELHLIGVWLVSHDLYEHQMIIIFCNFFAGHSIKAGQFTELAGGENPFAADTALTVE